MFHIGFKWKLRKLFLVFFQLNYLFKIKKNENHIRFFFLLALKNENLEVFGPFERYSKTILIFSNYFIIGFK